MDSKKNNTETKLPESTAEKRTQRIAQLRAKLQKEEALLNKSRREERNGQLVALGVLVEEMYKSGDESTRQKWEDNAKKHLVDRNLKRVFDAFERLKISR